MEELAKYEAQEVVVARDPEEILIEARRAAQSLTRIISAKPKPVIINGEQYLEWEDWALLGRFYGLTAKITETKPVTFGMVRGWEAHAVIVDRKGIEVGAADAMCLNDEEKWSTKAKYEWFYILKDGTKQKDNPPKNKILWIDNPKNPGKKMPKRERVKVADEPVPFFQLRSMAQTRACSKAMRQVLSWVVVLAGLKPNSVEDAEFQEYEEEEPPGREAAGKSKPEERAETEGRAENLPGELQAINEEQRKVILDAIKKKNIPLEFLEGYMDKKLDDFRGVEDLNSALEWIRKQAKV